MVLCFNGPDAILCVNQGAMRNVYFRLYEIGWCTRKCVNITCSYDIMVKIVLIHTNLQQFRVIYQIDAVNSITNFFLKINSIILFQN